MKVGEERNHVMGLVEIGNEAFIEDLMLKHLFCYDGFLEGDHVISRQAYESLFLDFVAESNNCVDKIEWCLRICEDKVRKINREVEEDIVLMEVVESLLNPFLTHIEWFPNLHTLIKAYHLPPLLLGIPDGILFEQEKGWRNIDYLSKVRVTDRATYLLKHFFIFFIWRERVDWE